MRHRAHQWLVAVFEMAVDHVVVTLVHRQVDGLADGTARVVHAGRHIGELHKVLEVFNGGVAAALVEVVHEGRPVGGDQHRALAADGDTARGVAGVLHVLTGRCRLNDLPAHAGGEAHSGAVYIGAGFLEQVEDFGVIKKIDANLGQQPVGIVFDQLQVFFAEDLNVGNVAFDEGRSRRGRLAPSLTSSGPTPAFSSARTFTHRATSITRCCSPLAFVPV